MPYIEKSQREMYNNFLISLQGMEQIETKGDLEYLVFILMKKFMSTREQRYSTLHDCVYATIHAGEEFKRRFLDKREDHVRQKNGDIE